MKNKYPLATFTWDALEYKAMQDVIHSNIFTMGPKVAEFENKFASYIGSKYAVMVNSGSSANLLMIASLFYTKHGLHKLKAGDEVVVPAVSWSTTYYPLYQYGLKIKFVDVDLQTLNINVDTIRKAIGPRTKAIFAVNLLGNPCELDKLRELAEDRGLILLEDNCESMGASLNNKYAGTYGLMGSYSTFFSHHISTMEGGLIVTDDEEIYQILLCLRAHGWTRNLPKNNLITGEKSDDAFDESFKFVLPGYNVRPLELEGALGIEQVKKLPMLIEERRKNGQYWLEKMDGNPYFYIQKENGLSSWFGFSIIIKPDAKFDRKYLVKFLTNEGFECRPIVAGNFAKNPVVGYFNYEVVGSLNNANLIDSNGLFIGNHHYPVLDAIDTIKNLVIKD